MIDMGWLGHIAFTWEFLIAVMSIVLIDLVLAGDNAVVIAMAVKNLAGKQRQLGIILGSGGAVVVRVICTFAVAQLLNLSFVKLIGGAVIIWIAVKLITQGAAAEAGADKEAQGLWQALWIIIVADLSMGIDNMLAVGAASHGNLFLLLFGLILSIPMVVLMSTMLAKLMDRYPIILWVGAAVLGKVGGEMMITDPWVHGLLNPPKWAEYASMAFFVVFVCVLSRFLLKRASAKWPPPPRKAPKPPDCILNRTASASPQLGGSANQIGLNVITSKIPAACRILIRRDRRSGSVLQAEIRPADVGILHEVGGVAGAGHAAAFEDVGPLGKAQRLLDVLLYEQDGDVRPECGQGAVDRLGDHGGEPQREFVHQQELGPAHQRPADGEHLLLPA